MTAVNEKIDVVASQVTVFNVYVNRIDEWWPRRGEQNRYSFAPESTAPAHIQFEPEEGGRFFEEFEDGTEYTIGTVEVYDPPNEIVYAWKAPEWPEATRVRVRFVQSGDTTTVMVEHTGFPDGGIAEGYSEGLREILGIFAGFVEA
ncbi:MAG: SRPBCC domain-containing protein [Acidimicrobiia bacterium]